MPILPCSMIAYAFAPSPVSIRSSWTSRKRATCPSIRYSLSPDLYSRRVTSTSRATDRISSSADTDGPAAWSIRPAPAPAISNTGADTCFTTPLNLRRTSAAADGLRASLPLLITSSMRSPRRLLALCSPITHVIASATLLLPQPFGPTMAVTPLSNDSSERSENDLNPLISKRSRRMTHTHSGHRHRCLKSAWNVWLGGRRTQTAVSVTRATYWGKTNLLPQFVVVS